MTESPTTTSSTSSDESKPSTPGCVTSDDGSLVVCFSRAVEVSRRADDRPTRWCFRCRARHPHETVVFAEPFPSYYEPTVATVCTNCHEDHTYFPGCGPL